RPRAAAGARRTRRDDGRHDRESAVYGRRRGGMVAPGVTGGDSDPAGLLHLARPEGAVRHGPGAREPVDAPRDARPRLALRADRDAGIARRARAAVPVGAGPGRPERAAAEAGVARDRQA